MPSHTLARSASEGNRRFLRSRPEFFEMSSSRLILCEKTARWAAALRAALPVGSQELQIIETRSFRGCEEALARSPASLVAVEVTSTNLEAALDFVSRTNSQHPHAAIIALISPEVLAAAPLLREAGAIDVAGSVLELSRLARLAQRHFRQAPLEPFTARQFVADRLPWPAHATNASAAQSLGGVYVYRALLQASASASGLVTTTSRGKRTIVVRATVKGTQSGERLVVATAIFLLPNDPTQAPTILSWRTT